MIQTLIWQAKRSDIYTAVVKKSYKVYEDFMSLS